MLDVKLNLDVLQKIFLTELVVDLDGLDIGTSIKISSINLPENVTPTIQGRDFVIATVAAPTVVKEPEKPAETEKVKLKKEQKQLQMVEKKLQQMVIKLKVINLKKKINLHQKKNNK